MKKQPTKKPTTEKHEPAVCAECLRVRKFESLMEDNLREATERLSYAAAALKGHGYQSIGYNLSAARGYLRVVADYAATLDAERLSAQNRVVVPSKQDESAT